MSDFWLKVVESQAWYMQALEAVLSGLGFVLTVFFETIGFFVDGYFVTFLLVFTLLSIVRYRTIHNVILLGLWPVRYPVMAAGYCMVFLIYACLKVVDPRGTDVTLVNLTKSSAPETILSRIIKAIKKSILARRNVDVDYVGTRARNEMHQVIDSVNGGFEYDPDSRTDDKDFESEMQARCHRIAYEYDTLRVVVDNYEKKMKREPVRRESIFKKLMCLIRVLLEVLDFLRSSWTDR